MDFTPLSTADRAHFETHGYLIVRNAISDNQVTELLAASDRLVASNDQQGRNTHDNGRYDGYRNCIAKDPTFLPLLTNGSTVPLAIQLLSPNLQLHTSHLIYKHPDDPAEIGRRSPGWHRDINTCPFDLGHADTPRLEIKICYQLSDASEPGCGQTLMAPGSHRLRTDLARNADGDPETFIEPCLAPGDAVLFENRTWHAGGHNRSGRTRKSVMFGYSYRWMSPDDYLLQDESLLARCNPIEQQLLGEKGGLFDAKGHFQAGGTERPLNDWCAQHQIENGWKKREELLHAV